jgi:hypothetical protein
MTGIWRLAGSRAEFNDSVSAREFQEFAKSADIRVLQCSSPVRESVWKDLNEFFLSVRSEVELRVYGHYVAECNFGFLRWVPNVRSFTADCLMYATGIEHLRHLSELRSLQIGVLGLKDFQFLECVPKTLTSLGLGATQSKAPSLSLLTRFQSLQKLYIEGHHKGIEALSEINSLTDLKLRSVTTRDLSYLKPLQGLRSLDVKLGGIRDFSGIEEKQSIQYFEMWQIRDVQDIDVLSSLVGLQNLVLQSLPHVATFPSLTRLSRLRRIAIENMRGLSDFSSLEFAPAIEEFALIDGRKQTPNQLLPVLRNPRLKAILAGFGSVRKNNEFRELRDRHGKKELASMSPFIYECSNAE